MKNKYKLTKSYSIDNVTINIYEFFCGSIVEFCVMEILSEKENLYFETSDVEGYSSSIYAIDENRFKEWIKLPPK